MHLVCLPVLNELYIVVFFFFFALNIHSQTSCWLLNYSFFFNHRIICLLVLNNFTRTTFFSDCWVFNMHKLAAQGLRLFVSFQRLDTEPTTLRLRGEERKLNVNLGSNLHIFQSASEALTPQPFVSGRLVCVQLWALWSVSCLWYELTCSITEEGVWLLHLELFVFSCLCGFHSVYL